MDTAGMRQAALTARYRAGEISSGQYATAMEDTALARGPLPAPAPARRRANVTQAERRTWQHNGPVTVTTVDPAVWRHALDLAGGDALRIVVHGPNEVTVVNRRRGERS